MLLLSPPDIYFRILSQTLTPNFKLWPETPKVEIIFSDLKGKDVVGMKKMLYKECAAWIACRQLLPAIALAAALAWLSAAS